MGIGAHHPRLLTHAVAEVKSYVKRIYPLVRLVISLETVVDHSRSIMYEIDFVIITEWCAIGPAWNPAIATLGIL